MRKKEKKYVTISTETALRDRGRAINHPKDNIEQELQTVSK